MGLALGPVIGRIGGGLEWVASGVTGASSVTQTVVLTTPSGQVAVVEVLGISGGVAGPKYRLTSSGNRDLTVPLGTSWIITQPGDELRLNDRITAVRYAMIDI